MDDTRKTISTLSIIDDNKNPAEKSGPPPDKYHLIHILFFFLGLVVILPWSFFVTAMSYWMYKFRNTTIDDPNPEYRSDLQAQFPAILTISLQISNVTFQFLSMFIGHRFAVKKKMLGSMGAMLFLMIVSTIFIHVDTDSWQYGFFVMTMVIVAIINAINAIFGMTMATYLSLFPPEFLAIYMNGQGCSGAITALLQIFSLSVGLSTENSALLYFLLGISIILITMPFYYFSLNNDYYQFYMRGRAEVKPKMISWSRAKIVSRKLWSTIVTVFFWLQTYNFQHSISPLVVSEDQGHSVWADTYFVPTITFFAVGVVDILGREAAIEIKFIQNTNVILLTVISFIRMLILIPLLLLCNAQPRNYLPITFPHDYQYIIIILVYAFTGSCILTTSNLNIPKLVLPEELENAYQFYLVLLSSMIGIFCFTNFVSVKLL